MAGEEVLVYIDDLTKVFNRRFLYKQLLQRINQGKSKGEEFTIILMDIDHFKIVNDSFGHLAGDEALQLFSNLLKDSVRKDDLVCRYAGDEFVLILTDSDIKRGIECGNRIIELLNSREFSLTSAGARVKLSVSMGVANFPLDSKDENALLRFADKSLYEAKRRGGGKVVRYKEKESGEDNIELNFGKFIGRSDILSLIKSSTESVVNGESKVFFVKGNIGIGKTRFLREASLYANLLGFKIFIASAVPQKISPPYSLFNLLLRNIQKGYDTKTLQNVFTNLSTLGDTLKWLIPDNEFGIGSVKKNVSELTSESDKHLLFEAVTRFISNVSDLNPLFLLLDDLQWIGEDDIEMLLYFIRNFSGSRILIGGAYRESEVEGERHPLKKAMLALSREGLSEKIDLDPLSDGEIKELISVVLGLWEVPKFVVDFIKGITEGNPLFVIEVLKMLVEKEYIYRTARSWNFFKLTEASLPEKISDLLKEKINLLSSESRKILMSASVIGEHFTLENLRYITGENEGYLIDLLDEALTKGIIVESKGEIGKYRFTYRMIRSVLYNLQSSGKRSLVHKKVGEMLELSQGDNEEFLENLANHFRNAGMEKKAFSYYLLCANKAERMMVYQKAISFYSEMLTLAKKMKKSEMSIFDLYFKLGYLYKRIGKLALAEEFFNDSLKIPEISGDKKAEVLHRKGNIYMRRGKFEVAIDYYKKARESLRNLDSMEAAIIYNDEAIVHLKKGNYTKAFNIAQKALDMLTEEHTREKSHILDTLGEINFFWGKMDEALKFFNGSLALAKKCGLENRIATAYKNIGRVCLEQGKVKDAERFLKIALESAERIGDYYLEVMIYNDLGIVFASENVDRAREYYLKSLNISKRIGDNDGVATIFNNIGDLYLRSIKFEKALNMFEEALRIWENIGKVQAAIIPYLNIGEIFFEQNDFDKALLYIFRAKEKSEEIKYVSGIMHSLFGLSELFFEQGNDEALSEIIEEVQEVNRTYKSRDYAAQILLMQARLALKGNDTKKAEKFYDSISEDMNETEDRSLQRDIEIFGGRLLGRAGRTQEALKYFERAEKHCEKTGDRLGFVSVLYHKAEFLKGKEEFQKAISILQKIRSMLEESSAKLWIEKIERSISEIR